MAEPKESKDQAGGGTSPFKAHVHGLYTYNCSAFWDWMSALYNLDCALVGRPL